MEFKDLQKHVIKTSHDYCEKYNVPYQDTIAALKLSEEVGELSEAILRYKNYQRPKEFHDDDPKVALAKELADVCCMTLVLANMYSIDLEEAIVKKWINREDWTELARKESSGTL